MDYDACEPGAELSFLPEGLKCAKGPHIRVLYDLLGFPVTPENAAGTAKQPPVIATHDLLIGVSASTAGKGDELMLACALHLACALQVRCRRFSAKPPHIAPPRFAHETLK